MEKRFGLIVGDVLPTPIGVMPKKIWMELRAKDLARAISEYIDSGRFRQVEGWVKELNELIVKLGEEPIDFEM